MSVKSKNSFGMKWDSYDTYKVINGKFVHITTENYNPYFDPPRKGDKRKSIRTADSKWTFK